MAWDPFKDGSAVADWDPFAAGSATEDEESTRRRENRWKWGAKNIGGLAAQGALDVGAGSTAEGAVTMVDALKRRGQTQAAFGDEHQRLSIRRRELERAAMEFPEAVDQAEMAALQGRIAELETAAAPAIAEIARRPGLKPTLAKLGEFRAAVRETYPVDQDVQASIPGQVVAGVGQAVAGFPAYLTGLGLPAGAAQLFDQAFQEAKEKGTDDATAVQAGIANLPGAVLEQLGDKLQIGGLIKALRGGNRGAKAVGRDVARAFTGEAGTEALQQIWQNATAQALYDPERSWTEGAGTAAIVGGLTGATVAGGAGALGEGLARLTDRRKPPPAPDAATPAAEPPPPSAPPPAAADEGNLVENLLNEQAAKTAAANAARAREAADRELRQQDLADKRVRFDERMAVAADFARRPNATFQEVNGALETAKFYAEDNSLGLTQDQREQATRAVASLTRRLQALQPVEDARRAAEAEQLRQEAEKAKANTNAAVKADKTAVREQAAAGIGPTGALDYNLLGEDRLAELAEQGDKKAESTLMRRAATETDNRPELLDVLARVKLPSESDSLPEELRTLIREEMTPQQRRQLVRQGKGELDYVAEALRADHGFAQIQTPADLIDAVQRALRGEEIRANQGPEGVDFATSVALPDEGADGPELYRKQMVAARDAGNVARYHTLRRQWLQAMARTDERRGVPGAERDSDLPAQPPGPAGEGPTQRPERRLGPSEGIVREVTRGVEVRVFPPTQASPDALRARPLKEIEAALRRGGIDRDRAVRALAAHQQGQVPKVFEGRRQVQTAISPDEAVALRAAVASYDAGQRFTFPSADLRRRVMTAYATSTKPRPAPITEAEAEREITAIRKASPQLTRTYDLEIGVIQDVLRSHGYKGQVPANVQAAILRAKAHRTLIVLGARTYRNRAHGAGLLSHEVAHAYWDTLTNDTRQLLRELHRREIAEKTGPLYRDGQLQSELDFLSEDSERGAKEWFAERIARLNEAWALDRIDRTEHSLLRRIAYQLREYLRKIWSHLAARESIDPDSELFVRQFREFWGGGADPEIGHAAGTAFASANAFREAFARWQSGTLARSYIFRLGNAVAGLVRGGLAPAPVEMKQSVLRKALNHGIGQDALEQLPDALRRPVAVFDTLGQPNRRIVLTELRDPKGKTVVAAFEVIVNARGNTVNDMRTAQGRAADDIFRWIDQGKTTWADKERALAWLDSTAPLPEATHQRMRAQIENIASTTQDDKPQDAVEFATGPKEQRDLNPEEKRAWARYYAAQEAALLPGRKDGEALTEAGAVELWKQLAIALRTLPLSKVKQQTAAASLRQIEATAAKNGWRIAARTTDWLKAQNLSPSKPVATGFVQPDDPAQVALPLGATGHGAMPLGLNVPSLPKIGRQAALEAELKRGRQLRDQGIKAGNDAAANEGVRIVKLATERLDDEFPGWHEAAKKPKPAAPAEEAAPGEPAPHPADQEPAPVDTQSAKPVRPGKFNEVYGHDAYEPTALARNWAKVRSVLRGIKGAVPELPAFPAAAWNRADRFLRDDPTFYNRIKEGLNQLRSSGDYIQKTAEEQLSRIVTPLIAEGGKFNADDYARLRKRQEQVRRAVADHQPVKPSILADIAALNSQLESSPYVLFNRLVLTLDLNWRHTNLKDSAGNPLALPAGINSEELQGELQRLGQRIEASPHAALIKTAVRQHMALVKQIAEDLKARELLASDHLANPYYFPHITLERTEGDKVEQREMRLARVKPGTEADFRGYLINPVGSTKAIATDYVRSMYYHLVQVGAHNLKSDTVRDYFRHYDIRAKVEARAREMARERGHSVSWEAAFHEEFEGDGYVLYGADSGDAFPQVTIDRDRLARRLGVMLTSEDLHKQLAELGLKGIKLLPQDLEETMQMGAREIWVVPARVAEALRGIAARESRQDTPWDAAFKAPVKFWKVWKLFMPWNHVRYEYGNVVADLEKIVSASPRTLKFMAPAAKELRAFWQGGTPGDDLRAALKAGVINAITAQEMGGLARTRAFAELEPQASRAWQALQRRLTSALYQAPLLAGEAAERTAGAMRGKAQADIPHQLGLGDLSSPELSAFREAVTRYANYKANLEAMRNNARPDYGGAYWRTIEAMQESSPGANDLTERKAAAIARATFGDYNDLSELGATLREKMIPFYSWMEVNFRYHANLLRNLRDMVRAGEKSQAEAARAGARAAAVFAAGFTARTAGGLVLRLALPYAAAMVWNNWGDNEEIEKLLSEEDRRRFHIVLGRDANGKAQVVYGSTALMDVLKWFSGPKAAQALAGWMAGQTDFPTAFAQWRDQLVPDVINNTIGSLGPYLKLPYTGIARKQLFPDVFDQRTVPNYDLRRAIIGQATDDFTADMIERIVSKDYMASKDLGDWAKQLILQVRKRDPEAWAFYAIKDKAAEFYEARTGEPAYGGSGAEKLHAQVLRNFRRAIYRGDVALAQQFYLRLLDYGYTAERFAGVIRDQDPLADLKKQNGLRLQFVESLTPFDREQLQRAYEYYGRISGGRGREAALFPRKATGDRGVQLFQQNPRLEALRRLMESELERDPQRRADLDLRRSLQHK